jgi:hypothetical protein
MHALHESTLSASAFNESSDLSVDKSMAESQDFRSAFRNTNNETISWILSPNFGGFASRNKN